MKILVLLVLLTLAACEPVQPKPTLHPELPQISVNCVAAVANGPPEVPFNHPVVEISGKTEGPLWLEIVVLERGETTSYLVSAFSMPTPYYRSTQDGWLGSIRGQLGYHIYSSEANYVVRGWRHPYTEETPVFDPGQLLFTSGFQIPRCED